MNQFNFFMPTKLVFGRDVVKSNRQDLVLGSKALLVTGRSSGEKSGALADVLDVLTTDYVLFAEVENNPAVETVERGAKIAREAECDYVIAIGGGSPLDAAKVIAALAVNEKNALELYDGWEHPALPLVAIPTTAGTGSEVTQYAVLTVTEEETKKGLGGSDLFPKIAFLDAKYTESLPLAVTVDTAVDALSHLIEGYLSKRATEASDLVALQGLALWGTTIENLLNGKLDYASRETLLLASTLGGITIAQTGTTLVHALGYPLTYFHQLPHGRANGILMGEFVRYCQEMAEERVATVLKLLELESVEAFCDLMDHLLGEYRVELNLTPADIAKYAERAALTKNVANSYGEPSPKELTKIMERSIIK